MSGHAFPALTLTLFGGFEARTSTGTLLSFRTAKERALVAYLAIEGDVHHSRSKLATLLWGETGEAHSRDSLRHALADVRRSLSSLATSPLLLSRDGVKFDRASVAVDVVRYQQLIDTGSSAAVRAAADLYRGGLLDGIVADEEAFERWLAERREALHALLLHALEKDLATQLTARRPEQAIDAAQRILRFDRAHENAHRALMRLYDDAGQRASALRQYRSCVASLEMELGTAPDRQTRALHDAILRAERGWESRHPTACNGARYDIAANGQKTASSIQEPFDAGLVGRDEEMALLRAGIDAAALGSGGCVFLIGEAGVGKTRLVREATLGLDGRALVLHARAYESERGHVLGVWADALRSVPGGGCDISVAQLDPVWARELVRLVPELVPGKREPVAHADERWLFEAVLRFVWGLAVDRAAVIIIDDLHWADDASVRLLAFLARRIASSRVLILATVREEEADPSGTQKTVDALTSASCARIIEVKPLREASTLELFDRLAVRRRPAGGAAQARARIWELSRGSPFMIVETVRAMREGMDLDAFAAGNVPESIRRVVGTRVRQLPEGARAVLAIAAVIGCEFDFALIARVAGMAASELVSLLEQLVRRRMVQVTEDRLGFTHAWIREWVYESLLPARRQLLHLEVARAYEAIAASGLESLPATLVHHYSQARAWPEAAANARRAGEYALRRGAYAEAAALFHAARFALEQLPRDARVAHDIVDLLVKIHRTLVPMGSAALAIRSLAEAEALAAEANEPKQRAAVLLCRSECARWTGDYVGAIEKGERGLSAAFEAGDRLLVAEARFHLGLAHFWKGHYRAAISTLRQSALAAREKGDAHRSGDMFYAVISSRQFLVLALASIGRFASARKVADEAIAIAATLDEPFREVSAARALGLMLVEKGEFDTAIPWLERTLARCEREHLEMLYALIAGTLGYAYALTGRAGEGIAMIEHAIARREAQRGAYAGSGAYLHSRLAEACIIDERIDAATAYVDAVTDFARRFDNRVDEAWSLRLSGDLAAHHGRRGAEEAERLYSRSRAIAARLGMAPFVAHCDRRIAGLAAFGLDDERSGAALGRARVGYARLAMSHWLTTMEQIPTRPGPIRGRSRLTGE